MLSIIILVWSSFIQPAFAQKSQKTSGKSLKEGLAKLSTAFQVNFIYESSLLLEDCEFLDQKKIKDKKLEDILKIWLAPSSLSYYQIDKANYAIFRQRSASINKTANLSSHRINPLQTDLISITGLVRNVAGQPMEFSSMSLLNSDSTLMATTIADSIGRYAFKALLPGRYMVRATRIGHRANYSSSFQLAANSPIELSDIILTELPRQLQQLQITSDLPLFHYDIDKTVINPQNHFAIGAGSLKDLLEISPGISIQNDQISMKGKQDVTIMIDKRVVKLSSIQLSNLLMGIPASSISRIELIHSPSASYDAQGKGGVINVVTLNGAKKGLNGTISSSLNVGNNLSFNENTFINYLSGKISISGNYSYQRLKNSSSALVENFIGQPNPLNYQQQQIGSHRAETHNAMLATDLELSPKHKISLFGSIDAHTDNDNLLDQFYFSNKGIKLPDSTVISLNHTSQLFQTYRLNFGSAHRLGRKGQLLEFNADHISYRSKILDQFKNEYARKKINSAETLSSDANVALEINTGSIDYSYPIGTKHTLQAGGKIVSSTSSSSVLFKYGNPLSASAYGLGRSNSFDYKECITALYLNYSGKLGKSTDLQLGIRAENTNYNGASISGDQNTNRSYTQFFPNLILSHLFGFNSISFSYNERVGRPSYQNLNPFITYYSPYSYKIGNQLLKPETTHSINIGYNYRSTLQLDFGYSKTFNYLGELTVLTGSQGIIGQFVDNFGSLRTLNLLLSHQQRPLNNWNLATSATIFHDRYQNSQTGSIIDNQLLGFQFTVLNSFELNRKLAIEITNVYKSKRLLLVRTEFGKYRADVALKYTFLDGKANLRMAVNDIFYSYLDRGSTQFQQLYSTYANRNENRRFLIGLTYNFGATGPQPKPNNIRPGLERIKP